MDYQRAFHKLKQIKQEHLLKFWDNLPAPYQSELLDQIAKIDIPTFLEQQNILHHPAAVHTQRITPYRDYAHSGNEEDSHSGQQIISKGKVGCVIFAGGEGTRLRYDGPKGMFPLTRIKHKSLLQLFAEKVVAASKLANFPLPLALMTSASNDVTIRSFFQRNNNFGLLKEQLHFFPQKMLPFLDTDANLFLSSAHLVGQGPNGNGYGLRYFVESGIWKQWVELGITTLNILPIDNPLADPFDSELVGYHHRTKAEITLKSVLRKDRQEKVGLIMKKEGKITVLEYTELPFTEREATISDGSLKHHCANIGLFCVSMDFVHNCAPLDLPLHVSFKTAKYVDEQGISRMPYEPNVWKFETFIFDTLPFATRIEVLLYPRKECFAPLKNAEGPDSLGVVQAALQESDNRIVKKISQSPPPQLPFELSQDFYYPTTYLLNVWQERPFPNKRYITEGS